MMNKNSLRKFAAIKTVMIEGEAFYLREPSLSQIMDYVDRQQAFFDKHSAIKSLTEKEKKHYEKVALESKAELTEAETAKLAELNKETLDISPEEKKTQEKYFTDVFRWIETEKFGFVFSCLCDENGKRLFQAGEEDELELLNKNIYSQLALKVWEMVNPPTNEAIEDSKKN